MAEAYVDSNVFLDYCWNRQSGMRPLGEFACQFITRALQCEFVVLITEDVVEEVSRAMRTSPSEMRKRVLAQLSAAGKLKEIRYTPAEEREARQVASKYAIPRADALHAVVARDNGAILVTSDKHLLMLEGKGEFAGLRVATPALV